MKRFLFFCVFIALFNQGVWGETQAQNPDCADCLEETKTEKDVKEFNEIVCGQIIKSEKCSSVPEKDLMLCSHIRSGFGCRCPFWSIGLCDLVFRG